MASVCSSSLAIVLAVTGPHLAHVNDAFQSACKAAGDCATAPNPVLNVDTPLQSALPFIVILAPALIGLFFGAPLIARELETGTFRLAWTQSVTRRRWLAVKLGLVGLAAMAIGGLLTWMVDWWASPLDAVNQNRFDLGELRLPRRRADRVRGVRLRARGDGRCAVAPDGPGDGRDARGVRRPRASRSSTGFARTSPRPRTSPSPSRLVRVRASSMGVVKAR